MIEGIFSVDGLGRMVVSAVARLDIYVIQGFVLWVALIYLGVNFLVDILSAVIDPRIKYNQETEGKANGEKEKYKEELVFPYFSRDDSAAVLIAILAPVLAPNDPYSTDLTVAQIGPCSQYPLGTDNLGRCMLSRVLYGARISIFSSLLITFFVFCIGVTIGSLCGYFGGAVDAVLNKIITIMQAFPQIVLAIAITGILGIGIRNTIIALCMVLWVGLCETVQEFCVFY